jgi:hypothetical protein
MNIAVRPFGIVPIMLNAVNDTLIFAAITYRILSYSVVGDSWSARTRSFFEADRLPRLLKVLLQGGQLYYLWLTFIPDFTVSWYVFFSVTIGLNIIFVAMILAQGMPPNYRGMMSIANLGLENAMACRVYRAVKLGSIKNHHSTCLSSAPDQAGHEVATDNSRSIQVKVGITRTTDMKIGEDDVSEKRSSLVEEGKGAYCQV